MKQTIKTEIREHSLRTLLFVACLSALVFLDLWNELIVLSVTDWLESSLDRIKISDSNDYSFAVFGGNENNRIALRQIIQSSGQDHDTAFILSLGDLVSAGEKENYREFLDIINKSSAQIPVLTVIGEKELTDEGRNLYHHVFGPFYYSFHEGGSYFIVLDDASGKSLDLRQLKWLKQELERASNFEHRFVFMHFPLYSPSGIDTDQSIPGKDADDLLRLFQRYKVTHIFASHIEGFYSGEWGGIPYTITNGAGTGLYGYEPSHNFYHYVKVHVTDGSATITTRRLNLPFLGLLHRTALLFWLKLNTLIRFRGIEIALVMIIAWLLILSFRARSATLRHTERDLQKERLFSQNIIEHSPVFYVALDTVARTKMMNQAMLTALGYSLDEVREHDYLEMFVPVEEQASLAQLLSHMARYKLPHQLENTVIARDGERLLVEWHGAPVLNLDGELEFFIGIGIDITERKKAEEGLRRSEDSYRRLFEDSPMSLWEIDLQRATKYLEQGRQSGVKHLKDIPNNIDIEACFDMIQILDVNRGTLELYHAESKVHLTENTRAIMTPESWQIFRDQLVHLVNGAKSAHLETVTRDLTGKLIQTALWWSVVPGYEIDCSKVLVSIADVTQKKQGEEMKRRLAAIVESADEAIFSKDCNGAITTWNSGAQKMYGYKPEEILGRPVSLIIPEDKREEADTILETVKKGEVVSYLETVRLRKDGQRIEVALTVSPIRNTVGQVLSASVIARDITPQRKLEAQLFQAQKMEAIGTLAGGIAHDFNNLLQAINGHAEMLLGDKSPKDPDYPKLKSIQKSGHRAANLIRQLLLFSRRADIECRPVDLNQEVEQARQMLERTIPKMVDIELHLGRNLWTVNADPIQMEQILLNLGGNAADAMPDGGRLVIETENITLDEKYTRSHLCVKPGRYVLLTVSDTGHGMTKDTMEKIYEPFFTTKEIGKGTGLGLASVYGIVKSHGGYIFCYSEVGHGTTFKIYLPVTKQATIDEKRQVAVKPPIGGTETILLVDDEDPIRDFASEAFERYGYTVLKASSGEEALEIFESRPLDIDLVIMDIGMPGMGGFRCLSEIIQRDPSAKVIIVSGYSVNGQVKKALEAGAVGYVGKPYQLTDLLNKIRFVLDQGGQKINQIKQGFYQGGH